MQSIVNQIAQELLVEPAQVAAAVQLLDNGDTVPFIARYRKEVTRGLTDTDLRLLEERLGYLRELEDRRSAILKSIEEQGKLTPELEAAIKNAETKARLEDLYLPYKPKRRTKAQIAREAGLEPLAQTLLADPTQNPHQLAQTYVNVECNIPDAEAALEGARYILMEQFSEAADLIGSLRDQLWEEGKLASQVFDGKEVIGEKYKDYFRHSELLKNIPSHRLLAILRGRNEDILSVSIEYDSAPYEQAVARYFHIEDKGRASDSWLLETARWTWRIKLFVQLELEFIGKLKDRASEQAIQVFAHNLRDLLMSAPAGAHTTLGLDPGFRTGVKGAIVDSTGKLIHHTTIYPHAPKAEWDAALSILADLCQKHAVELISIGNGTASRETDQLITELMKKYPELHLKKIVVSEAGASVYSASKLAAEEFPDLDVSIRGAVSIARRLQDPLAELVKIEPKAIGVGQYQHDVNQVPLAQALDRTVEDCVNAVGVDVNTASAALLGRVSGLNQTLAKNIVAYRDENGKFKDRQALLKVHRLGAKTFELAAGFLRILSGDNPLDASAVHPEAYPVVSRILSKTQKSIREVMGNKAFAASLQAEEFTDEQFGVPTVVDIIRELEKPGRDPRPDFKTACFDQTVHTLADLKVGMILEGVVTNVANFGAFVDIGVHQDGLVHISALSNTFITNPRDVVKAGDIVKTKVLEVDIQRKRIRLTLRLEDEAKPHDQSNTHRSAEKPSRKESLPRHAHPSSSNRKQAPTHPKGPSLFGSALQDAFKKSHLE